MVLFQRLTLLGLAVKATHGASGNGKTTRYWDCCKPSCSWPNKAAVNHPVLTCDKDNNFLEDPELKSGCEKGPSYACAGQTPWIINSMLSYGFAATAISGGSEASWCCACYAVEFTSGKAKGKIMVVQSTNTGGDLGNNQFDLAMPGGGLGMFDGCTSQFGGVAGSRYGGISNRSECELMPKPLQEGCYWRFDWFNNADNPNHKFYQISCPDELVNRTGCKRDDDAQFPKFTPPSQTVWTSPTPTGLAKAWEKCDDLLWDGPTKCESGYVCTMKTAYHWQCEPEPKPSDYTPTPSTRVASPTGTAVKVWEQCDSVTWSAPKPCVEGLKCVYVNDWYWQCQNK